VTGKPKRDIVVIGRGVPVMALRFVYLALCKDEAATIGRRVGLNQQQQRRIKFVTSVDPVRAAAVVADLDPASTMILSIALRGNEETALATRTLKSWLLQHLGPGRRSEVVLSKHMMLVTGNDGIEMEATSKPESVFLLPEHSRCEPFASFTAATLLPLAMVFGWQICQEFLNGAHDMDGHFVETNPRHNLPVLLALTDVWNDSFLGSNGRIVSPFTEAFAAYPAFCATLESQTCGNSNHSTSVSSLVIDGGLHHAYDRALYQTGRVMPSELAMTMDSQMAANAAGLAEMEDVHASQDALLCSMFAHADELAFGTEYNASANQKASAAGQHMNVLDDGMNDKENVSDGNRPSTLLLCGKLDAFCCGQLVALAEHRAVVKARIWDVDPFAKETGSALRSQRTETLRENLQRLFTSEEEDDDEEEDTSDPNMNLSTKTILQHYANMMRDQRIYTVKR
jgi:glucose-6-phosphate isomerase